MAPADVQVDVTLCGCGLASGGAEQRSDEAAGSAKAAVALGRAKNTPMCAGRRHICEKPARFHTENG